MTQTLPVLRNDVQISVHNENGEPYLVLHDPFGIAEGPIMVHADMVDVLQSCDGSTTYEDLATAAGVPTDGPEIMRLRVFLGQLDQMGYFTGEGYEMRASRAIPEWDALAERPPVCAGSVYPSDPTELATFLDALTGATAIGQGAGSAHNADIAGVLMPHIDFRVAPDVYAPGFAAIRDHDADLVVLIGTSHYWGNDAFILTEKDFATPIGTVQTDRALVRALAAALPGVAGTDLAHRPEHSLELHLVGLRHCWPHRPFTIVPILVTMEALATGVLEQSVDVLRRTVAESGRKALWLVSGDLAHVGPKFGDDAPARVMIDDVSAADRRLLDQLETASAPGYHAEIEATDHRYRVCGHAPTAVALHTFRPAGGEVLAYDVWHEDETDSAVSFATVVFRG